MVLQHLITLDTHDSKGGENTPPPLLEASGYVAVMRVCPEVTLLNNMQLRSPAASQDFRYSPASHLQQSSIPSAT